MWLLIHSRIKVNQCYPCQVTAARIDTLMRERRKSTANALELRLSCTNPSIWWSATRRWNPWVPTRSSKAWVSCQIRKIEACACAGNAGNVFPGYHGLTILTCITARAWRTCRDACRDRCLAVSFEVGSGANVPGIPGACATRNFTYLVRGPYTVTWIDRKVVLYKRMPGWRAPLVGCIVIV